MVCATFAFGRSLTVQKEKEYVSNSKNSTGQMICDIIIFVFLGQTLSLRVIRKNSTMPIEPFLRSIRRFEIRIDINFYNNLPSLCSNYGDSCSREAQNVDECDCIDDV